MCGISINGLHSTWIKTLFLICYIYIFFFHLNLKLSVWAGIKLRPYLESIPFEDIFSEHLLAKATCLISYLIAVYHSGVMKIWKWKCEGIYGSDELKIWLLRAITPSSTTCTDLLWLQLSAA